MTDPTPQQAAEQHHEAVPADCGFPTPGPDSRCPCTSGLTFSDCCGPFLDGSAVPPTAQALMRSRFTAFATGNADYLLATWLGETAPETLYLDPRIRFYRLDIHSTTAGGPFDTMGSVDFEAFYRVQGGRGGSQREHSRFGKAGGRWYYIGEA